MAADLIVYAIIAAALVFWLKNILGTKNGEERDRPNPFEGQAEKKGPVADAPGLPPVATVRDLPMRVTKTTLVGRVKIETPNAESGLRDIARADPRFNLDRFMEGAEGAFELIVTSFAKGDRTMLKSLLAPSVYVDFDRALTEREGKGETVSTDIVAIAGMDIISAQIRNGMALVAVRFTADEICLIRNASGAITGGDPEKTTRMIDIWTFGRDLSSNDPTWLLMETRDERAEDHKTPIPESK